MFTGVDPYQLLLARGLVLRDDARSGHEEYRATSSPISGGGAPRVLPGSVASPGRRQDQEPAHAFAPQPRRTPTPNDRPAEGTANRRRTRAVDRRPPGR